LKSGSNFDVEEDVPPRTILSRLDGPVKAVQLCRWQHSHKKNFFQVKCTF